MPNRIARGLFRRLVAIASSFDHVFEVRVSFAADSNAVKLLMVNVVTGPVVTSLSDMP